MMLSFFRYAYNKNIGKPIKLIKVLKVFAPHEISVTNRIKYPAIVVFGHNKWVQINCCFYRTDIDMIKSLMLQIKIVSVHVCLYYFDI